MTDDCLYEQGLTCNGCGESCGILNTSAGSFDDGSGDDLYASSSVCIWLIAPTPKTGSITVTFDSFSLEEGYDVVLLLACADARCNSQSFIALLTGEYDSEQSFTIAESFVLVVFVSDEMGESDGFTASWTSSASVSACH
jgi:hypothetical protein